MTKEKAKELSDILKAYSEGKTIQICCGNQSWRDVSDVEMDKFAGYSQPRVKQEPKLVPFTFEDKQYFKNLWFKSKGGNGTLNSLVQITKDDVLLVYGAKNLRVKYIELLNSFEFEDGSPCGKYVNE